MLRTPASRALLASLAGSRPQATRLTFRAVGIQSAQLTAKISFKSPRRPQLPTVIPTTALILRHATTTASGPGGWSIDKKKEAEYGEKKLPTQPGVVSATSSTHPIFGEVGVEKGDEGDVDMSKSLRADINTIKETFNLSEVPRQAYYMGFAGVVPYLATSLGTVFCAHEINHAAATGTGYLMQQGTAELFLHLLEPIQIGYGAVILSFLGAIHWGLEWAGYGGYHGYRRYAIGVVAPAVAWPTLLLSPTYALIAQFFAFNFLYYADSRATTRGWAPPWYGTYRFVLTFIVGASIVISLIGRSEIADKVQTIRSPVDRIRGSHETMEQQFKEEEAARAQRYAALSSSDMGDSSTSQSADDTKSEGDESESKSASSGSEEGGEEKDEGKSGEGEGEGEKKE